MLIVKGTQLEEAPGRVGSQRPSAFMYTAGVGALVDLPHMTVVVDGLDRWNLDDSREVQEKRLLAAVQHRLGDQVAKMCTPPHQPSDDDPFGSWTRVGVPVTPFPRWLRCTRTGCRRMGSMDSGLFWLDYDPVNPDGSQFRHQACRGPGARIDARAISVRFVYACDRGHLDDFPFDFFVHGAERNCDRPSYEIEDFGQGLSPTVQVRCASCDRTAIMSAAFGEDAYKRLPACRGRHPHLGTFEGKPCTAPARTMVLGASNLWFSQVLTSLYLPEASGDLATLVRDFWHYLQTITDTAMLQLVLKFPELQALRQFSPDDILAEIDKRRRTDTEAVVGSVEPDLKKPEWDAFTAPLHGLAPGDADFRLRPVASPASFPQLARVVQVERLREAKAFVGFTRIGPYDPEADGGPTLAPMTKGKATWVPAVDGRGEGIFIQLDEATVQQWERSVLSQGTLEPLIQANNQRNRDLGRPDNYGWIGERGVLLHTLSHMLIRQLALDCGYAAASLSERIYAGSDDDPQAGILIYTTAADTEGTLGGLVALGEPENLDRLMRAALHAAGQCSADPLCAEHSPNGDTGVINGAACHLCTYVAETTCEYNNRYLDRRVLAEVGANATPFMGSW